MARKMKRPPGLGRPLQRVMLGGFDTPRVTRKIPRKQACSRRALGPGERAAARELARLGLHLSLVERGRL